MFQWDRAAPYLEGATRERAPRHVTFRWDPHEEERAGMGESGVGVGATGAWWVREVEARGHLSLARVDATSWALAGREVVPVRSGNIAPSGLTAARWQRLDWQPAAALPVEPRVEVTTRDVAEVTLALDDAGLAGGDGTVVVETDGATTLSLSGLAPGARAHLAGDLVAVAGDDGRVTGGLEGGTSTLKLGR